MGTRTEYELEQVQRRELELRAQLEAEEAAKADATPEVRELAVALHSLLCPDEHPAGCAWFLDPAADDPEGADWTQADHLLWLDRARASLGWMVRHGWTVIPPGHAEPLPAPPETTS